MPHQGGGLAKSDSALNYETALLECASGSRSAVGQIYAREKAQLRAVAHRIVRDKLRAEDVIHDHSRKSCDMPTTSILPADPPGAGSTRIVRNTALKVQENARRELALEDETRSTLICEREQAIRTRTFRTADDRERYGQCLISSSQGVERRACFWRSSTGARTRRLPNASGFQSGPSRLGSGESSWRCAESSNETVPFFVAASIWVRRRLRVTGGTELGHVPLQSRSEERNHAF